MLSGPRFRDDPPLSQPLRQQDLADRVIDLVRPRMIQILALQKDLRLVFCAKPPRQVQWRGSAHIIFQERSVLPLKRGLIDDFQIPGPQFFHIPVEHLRNIGAAESAIIPLGIRRLITRLFYSPDSIFNCHDQGFFIASSIVLIFLRSFTPGLCSNLLLISIENNLAATRSCENSFNFSTSPGSIPPLKKNNLSMRAGFSTSQLNFFPVPP